MKGVILQPSFLPWRGFFDLIYKSDVFVFLDDVQYDKRSWRNRNKIKAPEGVRWITVPVATKGLFKQKILDTLISHESPWKRKMLETIYHSYKKAPWFDRYYPILEDTLKRDWAHLADLDIHLTREIMNLLDLKRALVRSSELGVTSTDRNLRLIEICRKVGITHYITGPSTRDYIDEEAFENNGIALEVVTYQYPPYEQLHGKFEPQVSVVDLLFSQGPESHRYIWGARSS